jgi:hypothetical protein
VRNSNAKGLRNKSGLIFVLALKMKSRLLPFMLAFWLTQAGMDAHGQQFQLDRNSWDFGSVAFWKNDTAQFVIRNAGSKDLVFLPVYYNENHRVNPVAKRLAPGESTEIYINLYTRERGPFQVSIPVYINLRDEPILFQLKGNIKGFHPEAMLRCPVVNAGPAGAEALSKVFTLEVRDQQTDELLEPDKITVKNRSGSIIRLERSGAGFEMLAPPGPYLIDSRKKGYLDYFASVILEPYRSHMVVYMDRRNEPIAVVPPSEPPAPVVIQEPPLVRRTPPVQPPPGQEEPEVEPDPEGEIWDPNAPPVQPPANPPAPVPPAKDSIPSRTEIPETPKLDPYLHNANNIVMVLDISYSMKRDAKLELLRTAMQEMASALRPMDKVTLITLAGEANIIFQPSWIHSPDSLLQLINALQPAGGTNGAAAMRLAYTTALKEKLEGGNNQVIVATDGVFTAGTMGNEELLKLVNTYREKGIWLSTIGFGEAKQPIAFLSALAAAGGGDFLHIRDQATAERGLVEQLRRQSRK